MNRINEQQKKKKILHSNKQHLNNFKIYQQYFHRLIYDKKILEILKKLIKKLNRNKNKKKLQKML